MKKLLSLLLASLLLTQVFVSCAENTEDVSTDSTVPADPSAAVSETEEETEITRENIPDNLPEKILTDGRSTCSPVKPTVFTTGTSSCPKN